MNKKIIGIFALISVALLSFGGSIAMAFPKVYSPIIETREIEIEQEGLYTFDKRKEKDHEQTQKIAIGYGFLDWWATEIYGEWEKNPEEGHGLEFENIEWENRFQLWEQGKYWLDAGLYEAYEFASEKEDPDKLELKLLLEKQTGDFVHRANLILEREIGGQTPEGEEKEKHEWEGGVAWSTRYRWKEYFEPGFEIHYDAKALNEHHSFNEQEVQIGPAFYGKIGPIKYDIGYLFGVSDEAPDGMLKWVLEYELRF